MSDPPRTTPVLVGIGVAMQREDDPADAKEALELMLDAVRSAGAESSPALLRELGSIAVPRGRWSYRNPAGAIARAIGATEATTVMSSVGVLQQTLIADACEAIARGEVTSALVVGADAGYRLLRARLTGGEAAESVQEDEPDVLLEPTAELRHPAERAAGLTMPVGLYALIESARRARAGLDIAEHRLQVAEGWARLAAIAAANPHAWNRSGPGARAICEDGPRNPMQAFPYTRWHCSTWNVDQAAALLFCSAERAEALGIDRAKWLFPVASAEFNHMVPVVSRADLTSSPGAEATARAMFADAGVAPADIDLVDLYSCFPAAVEVFAEAAGLPPHRDLSITGGMAFAGGPYNNYFFQATARAAELLRQGTGRTALLSCVSGIMTKQAFALWSIDLPSSGFVRRDVTTEVAEQARVLPVVEDYVGDAVVAACTTIHARDSESYAVALVDTREGERALATSRSADVVAGIEQEEWVGRSIRVVNGEIAA